MSSHTSKNQPTTFSRHFSIAGLISILVTAIALTWLYRQTSIDAMISQGEQKNIVIAQTMLNAIKPTLVSFLDRTPEVSAEEHSRILSDLSQAVHSTMAGTTVVRVKVYDRWGTVAYSTKTSQIGQDGSHNLAFVAAMDGRITSKLIYRGTFNVFDMETEEANLIQTYIPVYVPGMQGPHSVFELYTDVHPLVAQIERSSILLILGVVAVLSLLYIFLRVLVHKADKVIVDQYNTILSRSESLELLSAQLLTAEERERKKLAERLHEGLAQSLAAIKFLLENQPPSSPGREGASLQVNDCTKFTNKLVSNLQSVIQETRSMAMELRPPSLDDIGLLPTINWLCREFEAVYPDIIIEKTFDAEEKDIPHPLKIIVYRIIQETISEIGKQTDAGSISIRLKKRPNTVILEIEDNASIAHPSPPVNDKDEIEKDHILSAKERVILSGGTYKVTTSQQGGSVFETTWQAST